MLLKYGETSLSPYAVAREQVELAKAAGKTFRLTKGSPSKVEGKIKLAAAAPVGEVVGEVCKDGACSEVDPMVIIFVFIAEPIVKALNDPNTQEKINYFLRYPLGGPNSDFKKIRDAIIGNGNDEITQLIRDPTKRPVEIFNNWRDHLLPPDSSNDVVKILKNPLKCTVGKIFGARC